MFYNDLSNKCKSIWCSEMTNKEIEMLSYSYKGKIKPIRFRFETPEGQHVIKPISIVEKLNNSICVSYDCAFVLNNTKYHCEIHYLIYDMRWIIYKMF